MKKSINKAQNEIHLSKLLGVANSETLSSVLVLNMIFTSTNIAHSRLMVLMDLKE